MICCWLVSSAMEFSWPLAFRLFYFIFKGFQRHVKLIIRFEMVLQWLAYKHNTAMDQLKCFCVVLYAPSITKKNEKEKTIITKSSQKPRLL